MKILQIHNPYRQRGGEDGVVEAEARLLREGGHTVIQHLVANDNRAVQSALQIAASPWNLRQARRAVAAAEHGRPDVAHIHNTWFALTPSVPAAIHAAGIPTVMTMHNYRLTCANALLLRDGAPCTLCVSGSAWNGARHRCYRGSVAQSAIAAGQIAVHRRLGTWNDSVDLFLPLWDFQRDLMIRSGFDGDKMAVKPNFTADPGSRTQDVETSSDVLFVGRLSPEKGVGVLLEAWKRAELSGLRLLVIGDGPAQGELEREAGERDDIVFLGRVDASAVSRLMLQARALVVPSIWFEAPLTILEAFASGLPVLASALGPMIEYVGAIGPQWLFAAQDPTNLAETLQMLRQDHAVTAAGRAARREYEASFTPAAALSNLVDAYQRACDGHGAHR